MAKSRRLQTSTSAHVAWPPPRSPSASLLLSLRQDPDFYMNLGLDLASNPLQCDELGLAIRKPSPHALHLLSSQPNISSRSSGMDLGS